MRGKVLDSAPLHSEQCIIWLKEALNHAVEIDSSTQRPTASTYRVMYDSSDDEVSDEFTGSSSGEDNMDEVRDTFDYSLPMLTVSKSNVNACRQSKKSKGELDQHQKDVLIRKHADSIPSVAFDLPNGTLLNLASSLLSKEDFLSDSLITQGRSYQTLSNALSQKEAPIVVLFLRSGRFAGAVFAHDRPIVHRTSARYTVRKGQGKAQSAQDAQRKAKSIGAQLRRQGEISLQEDVSTALLEWKEFIDRSALIFISVPRTMLKGLFDSHLKRDDPRIRRVPMDLGRPTFENVCVIHAVLTMATIREKINTPAPDELSGDLVVSEVQHSKKQTKEQTIVKHESLEDIIPLSELHIAAQMGNLEVIQAASTAEHWGDWLSHRAGPNLMTPLHYAAEAANVDPETAADCVRFLLETARADPCIVDRRRRVPYFLASHDAVRDAFRRARANLGETYCSWDEKAKVGPPLTEEALHDRNEKEAEKRKKKRAKQKEKKARENADAKEAECRKVEADELIRQEEDAKRIRDGLKPKKGGGGVCDFCQTVCLGRKRTLMLKRLDYTYCGSECVQKHKRELAAAAATARLSTGSI